jgi:hypothetical protein
MNITDKIDQLYLEMTGLRGFGPAKVFGFQDSSQEWTDQEKVFYFLRTFVPYYYSCFKDHSGMRITDNADFFGHGMTGLCAGDAHCDNFGISFNADNNPVFSINDFDDCGVTYFYAELVRFLTSVVLKNGEEPEQVVNDLLSFYKTEIQGERDPRNPTPHELTEWKKGSWDTPKDQEDQPHLNPDDPMVLHIGQSIKYLFNDGNLEIISLTESTKSDGGSGFLKRYRVRFGKIAADGSISDEMDAEFKQEVKPGLLPLWVNLAPPSFPRPDSLERIPVAMQWELGNEDCTGWSPRVSHTQIPLYRMTQVFTDSSHSQYDQVVPNGTYTYLVRPRIKGLKATDKMVPDYFTTQASLFQREAQVLGYLHAHQPACINGSNSVAYLQMIDDEQGVIVSDVAAMCEKMKQGCAAVLAVPRP